MSRTARDVVDDHLDCRARADLEADLARNYSPKVVLISAEGLHHGHDGVRTLAGVLHVYVPEMAFRVERLVVHDRFGWLEWSASGDDGNLFAHDGVDSFVVEDDRIVAQTIHFSVTDR